MGLTADMVRQALADAANNPAPDGFFQRVVDVLNTAQPSPEDAVREAAWLIERLQIGDTPTAWWTGSGWIEHVCDACVRFARKQDAKQVINATNDWWLEGDCSVKATEHVWIGEALSPTPPAGSGG